MGNALTNPRVRKNGLLLLGAGLVGPALIVAGLRYPGSMKSKAFLASTGVAVSGVSYYYFSNDVKALLSSKG